MGHESPIVAQWGCKAIVALSVLESNKLRFQNTETCNAVVKSLKTYGDDVVVAEWGCAAVCSISSDLNRSKLGTFHTKLYLCRSFF